MNRRERKLFKKWRKIGHESFVTAFEQWGQTPEGKAAILEMLSGNEEPFRKWEKDHREKSLQLIKETFDLIEE